MSSQKQFAVLDFDSEALPGDGPLLLRFEQVVCASQPSEVLAALAQLDALLKQGYHAAGYIAYEAAAGFDSALRTHPPGGDLPLFWFGLTRQVENIAARGPERRLPERLVGEPTASGPYEFSEWQPLMSVDHYRQASARIRQHIVDGESYQVNLTFPLRADFRGQVHRFYEDARRAQAARYCAWLHADDWHVLSLSPELFFELRDGRIRTRPMKGTRRRGLTQEEDQAVAAALRQHPKDRAENVMIVDLLRNDLGRVAEIGSVVTPRLFEAEKYPTLWQMTSTVEAQLRPEVGLEQVFKAIFPCGSVTGAPKVKTMEIIERQEVAPRGVYCGAIGYLGPDGSGVFNVPIRTAVLRANGQASYHVGSGLVADSEVGDEYEECLLKARVLQQAGLPPFQLLETMRYDPGQGIYLLERHLQRLGNSAAYFDFACDFEAVRARLDAAVADCHGGLRLRLLVAAEGEFEVQATRLDAKAPPIHRVALAAKPIDRTDPFLYHKTTLRQVYEEARAQGGPAEDVILFNEQGQVTESCIANVAVEIDGRWLTPPVECGLLGGVMRAELLARGELHEHVVGVAELKAASQVKLFNSVRGEFVVTLLT